MEVDLPESKEERSFIPSAVSSSAGWHEAKFMCDRHCQEEGFQYFDSVSVVVEDSGELCTRNLCKAVTI